MVRCRTPNGTPAPATCNLPTRNSRTSGGIPWHCATSPWITTSQLNSHTCICHLCVLPVPRYRYRFVCISSMLHDTRRYCTNMTWNIDGTRMEHTGTWYCNTCVEHETWTMAFDIFGTSQLASICKTTGTHVISIAVLGLVHVYASKAVRSFSPS